MTQLFKNSESWSGTLKFQTH